MKGRYDAALEQADKAQTEKEKTNSILSIVKTMATNHLPTMEEKIDRNNRKMLIGMLVILLAVLFQDQLSLPEIFAFLMRLF